LEYAYENKQYLLFNFLLRKLIEFQDCFESQHLLTSNFFKEKENDEPYSLLESAISDSLDISFVFDSMLFTKHINEGFFNATRKSFSRHPSTISEDNFPELHSDPSTFTAAYESNSIIEFLFDDSVYKKLFSQKFPASKAKDKKAEKHLIEYDLDYLLTSKSVFRLLKLLSKTDNMSYFQSPFIRRMINNQWFNYYRTSYMRVLWVTCLTYFLNVVDIVLINYD
jgi:hypothetical protein